MLSSNSLPYPSVPTSPEDSDAKKNFSELLIHPFDIDSRQMNGHGLHEEKSEKNEQRNIDDLIQALVKGNTKTYLEKVKLAFKSSFLSMPLFFMNSSFIFFDTQAEVETAMRNNPYYDHFFPKLIKTFSYEAGIVRAEAAGITTPTVLLTNLITTASFGYQGVNYLLNKKEMKQLVQLLDKKNYTNAEKILPYSLSRQQLNKIRLLVEADAIDETTIIEADLSHLEKFTSDMLWFHEESNKYIAPLLLLSLIPGFLLMFSTAKEIDADMDCSLFSLWGLLLNVCPTIQKVELMSLLTYIWGCFSGTYLFTHSFALVSRMLMTPFPKLREKFQEKINKPVSEWWAKDQLYDKLIEKSLLATVMPLVAGYSLYSALQFTNTYLWETGCSPEEAFSKAFTSSGKAYPCSTAQASLGGSVLVGEFEFNHLYPAYMAIEALTWVSAFIVKRIPYFKQERIIEKAKKLLKQFTPLEDKMTLALASGVAAGGLAGIWPALQMANTIIQKEGFELFFPLNSLPPLTNGTLPATLPEQALPIEEIINNLPPCTIDSTLGIPDVHLGNTTISGFNTTFPCLETFYDEDSNTTIIGLQVTPPCPNESIYSTFYRSLLHFSIPCDPILVVRGFAGFVVPYWLSVNSGAAFSTSLAAAILFSVWAIQTMRNPSQEPVLLPVNGRRAENRGNYSPRLFSNTAERTSLRSLAFNQDLPAMEDSSDDEDLENNFDEEAYLNRHRAGCWSRFKTRISQFFSSPPSEERAVRGSRKPLLSETRNNFL